MKKNVREIEVYGDNYMLLWPWVLKACKILEDEEKEELTEKT